MGKRELLLVVGFALAGVVVYQVTAQPAAPGDHGFSMTTLIEQARRHLRGNRASADVTTRAVYPLTPATTELRLTLAAESLTIVGEDRQDVECELHVSSNGFDEQEAEQLARETVLNGTPAGDRFDLRLTYPEPGRQRANLVVRMPARLAIAVGRYSGTLSISDAAAVELGDSRGDATIRQVAGRVSITHRGGDLHVSDVAALKLSVRGADARLARVSGPVTIQAQAGEVHTSELGGPVDVDVTQTDLRMERLDSTTAPVRVTATRGSVRLTDVRSDTRVDARGAEVVLEIAQPATVSVHAEGGEPLEVTAPPGGFELDAVATSGGRITAPAGFVEVEVEGEVQRVKARLLDGGPTITLRADGGEIVIRGPSSRHAPGHPAKPERE